MREMFSTLLAKLALLHTKIKVVAPLCVVPSSCRVTGMCVEDMVAPEMAIPVPAVSVFCFAPRKVVRAVVSV
jgi:hypothetical protein